ncbi:hypothetical protein [Bacillus phage Nachito]|nr:hypothetical protein [Bacillus phage Nachito]
MTSSLGYAAFKTRKEYVQFRREHGSNMQKVALNRKRRRTAKGIKKQLEFIYVKGNPSKGTLAILRKRYKNGIEAGTINTTGVRTGRWPVAGMIG